MSKVNRICYIFLNHTSICQFLLVLRIGNGNIQQVISWRQLIVLYRSVKREVLQVHVIVASDKTEEQQGHPFDKSQLVLLLFSCCKFVVKQIK